MRTLTGLPTYLILQFVLFSLRERFDRGELVLGDYWTEITRNDTHVQYRTQNDTYRNSLLCELHRVTVMGTFCKCTVRIM
jgi:hypothetical protein